MAATGNGKKISINVYLLKENGGVDWTEDELIASPIGAGGKPQKIQTDKHLLGPEGNYGTLFIRKPILESTPDWLDFIGQGLDASVSTEYWKNKSISALLVVSHQSRQFAVAFGHGRHMIDPRLVEDRFGIKVVLNSVSPDRIASIDKQTFDESPRISRTQTIKASSVSDYMINADQDLLRGLVGFTKPDYSDVFGAVIAGIDSFRASVPADLTELKAFLATALDRSTSKDYLAKGADGHSSEFAWVENLLPVKDKDVIDALERELWNSLKSQDKKNMWLAIPDIINWNSVSGFSYKPDPDDSEVQESLHLDKFLETLRSDATLETIKRREIYLMRSDGRPPERFMAFKCIYAELKHKAKLFILHAGNWFGVDSNFQGVIEKYYGGISKKSFSPPFVEYDHAGEGDYNESVCKSAATTHAMLDRQLIRFGGSHDKIEVCDIYRKRERGKRGEFIHVKRGRGSATLSHLFAQGLVASVLMVREREFVKDVNKQLKKQGFSPLPEIFEAKGNDVVYAIIDGDKGSTLDIPFFSKVTLQSCGKTITSYGYGLKILHIPESAAHLAKVAAKAAEKAAKKAAEKAAKAGKPAKAAGKGKAKPPAKAKSIKPVAATRRRRTKGDDNGATGGAPAQ